MRILHISTSDQGGAGIAALRQHEALLNAGVDSRFLCLTNSKKHFSEVYQFKRPSNSLLYRGLKKVGLYRSQTDKTKRELAALVGSYEIFSFPVTDYNILSHPLVQDADVINLHWVANFLDWPSFFSGIKKPIVWTLHDMNPFLGGFHYKNDVKRNLHVFSNLDHKIQKIKQKAISKANQITIVCLTEWLKKLSKDSEILGSTPHHLIPNSINLNIFKQYQQDFAREVFALPKHKKIILFVSQSTNNKRKGLDLLAEAFEKITDKENFFVVAVGEKPKETNIFPNVHFLGSIHDDRLMALVYSTADIFVIPSLEDNLPNVMLEALACGIPVIGFPIGGIKETIHSGVNGLLANEVSAQALSDVITQGFQQKFDSLKIRRHVEHQFSPELQAQRYIKLYHHCLAQSDGKRRFE